MLRILAIEMKSKSKWKKIEEKLNIEEIHETLALKLAQQWEPVERLEPIVFDVSKEN